jgi:hypothetical protein
MGYPWSTVLYTFCGFTICTFGEPLGRFHRGVIIQGVLLYTMPPWKTPRKSMGEWDNRTKIIPLLLSRKPGHCCIHGCTVLYSCFHLRLEIFLTSCLWFPNLKSYSNILARDLCGNELSYAGRTARHVLASIQFTLRRCVANHKLSIYSELITYQITVFVCTLSHR